MSKYISTFEAAYSINANVETVRRWVKDNKFKTVCKSRKEGILIDVDSFEDFLKKTKRRLYANFNGKSEEYETNKSSRINLLRNAMIFMNEKENEELNNWILKVLNRHNEEIIKNTKSQEKQSL